MTNDALDFGRWFHRFVFNTGRIPTKKPYLNVNTRFWHCMSAIELGYFLYVTKSNGKRVCVVSPN